MKNTAINTLKYTGIVTLSQYIGTKKFKIAQQHNAGGSYLFDFLAHSLIGDFTYAKILKPTKVVVLKRKKTEGNDGYTYISKSGFITLTTNPEIITDNDKTRVRYSFIIPKDQVESLVTDDLTGLCLGLYSNAVTDFNELHNYSAICEIGSVSKNALINSSLVVDWELVISNI